MQIATHATKHLIYQNVRVCNILQQLLCLLDLGSCTGTTTTSTNIEEFPGTVHTLRYMPAGYQGWDNSMGQEEIKSETNRTNYKKPEEVKQISYPLPISTGDILWIHQTSLISHSD